jgi:hypothetical protein
MIKAAEQIASGQRVRLQGLEIQTSRVFLVFEPPCEGSIGGLVTVGEYTADDNFRVLHGDIPEIFSMYLAPILALGFAKIELQRAALTFAAGHGNELKAAMLTQADIMEQMSKIAKRTSERNLELENELAMERAEIARLRKALDATGGTPLENQFQVLPEQCDFTDPVHGRCTNKPTTAIPMQVAVCDVHREAETVEIGGVDVEPGTFN